MREMPSLPEAVVAGVSGARRGRFEEEDEEEEAVAVAISSWVS
jgi:hypothetical protein